MVAIKQLTEKMRLVRTSCLVGYSCKVATDQVGKFAERAIKVERILDSRKVGGSAGRVAFILAAANRSNGVTQRQLVAETALPKDVVSKLVGSLVRAGLLDQMREDGNARIKRLSVTGTGKRIISEIKATLQPSSPAPIPEKPAKRDQLLWDNIVAK